MITRAVFRTTSGWKKRIGNTSTLYDYPLLTSTLIWKNENSKGCCCCVCLCCCYCCCCCCCCWCCSRKQTPIFLRTQQSCALGIECKIASDHVFFFNFFIKSYKASQWAMLSTKQYYNYIFFSVKPCYKLPRGITRSTAPEIVKTFL